MNTIELPFEYLAAAVLSAAHQDVRFYLCGVMVGNGLVAGTNGHTAVIIQDDGLKDIPQIIIPRETIEWLIKKVRKSNVRKFTANISDLDGMDGTKIIKLDNGKGWFEYEIFKPIDGKFPDVMRVLVIRDQSAAVAPMFNFDYIKLMAEAGKILTGSPVSTIRAFYGEKANEAVYFPLATNCHGLIMPMRT